MPDPELVCPRCESTHFTFDVGFEVHVVDGEVRSCFRHGLIYYLPMCFDCKCRIPEGSRLWYHLRDVWKSTLPK